ncbi:hypothetical protein LIA77_10936 [Sarocladium implicatum]|nr:hypothetical protein LIA77_10936 [Sarocladium implicatum]
MARPNPGEEKRVLGDTRHMAIVFEGGRGERRGAAEVMHHMTGPFIFEKKSVRVCLHGCGIATGMDRVHDDIKRSVSCCIPDGLRRTVSLRYLRIDGSSSPVCPLLGLVSGLEWLVAIIRPLSCTLSMGVEASPWLTPSI